MNLYLPRVSVLLPVYNGETFLADSIDSILSQNYENFELIIINDGSADNSARIVKSYSDSRIRYYEHQNIGLPATLNKGAQIARGEFYCRQDQDDISHPDRILNQVSFMDEHPEVVLLGTWARIFVDKNPTAPIRYHKHPLSSQAIALSVIFNSPFVHSSVLIRRSAFDALGGYCCDPLRQPPEDFEFWSRLCPNYQTANLPEVLLHYREVRGSMSRVMQNDFVERMLKLTEENLRYWLKGCQYEKWAEKISKIYHLNGEYKTDPIDGDIIKNVLNKIKRAQSSLGDTKSLEYNREFSRIGLQLMRNYRLGLGRTGVYKIGVKSMYKVMRLLHE